MAPSFSQVDQKAIDTIRILAADITSKANSGHPGAPMGLAPVAHLLWQYVMKFNPKNPEWYNRDRFVLSNGHACALQYTMLYLYGYDYTLDDLQHFRKLYSKTPGHPERELPGVEVTTGPLGQGISNAVGIAIAEKSMAAQFNKPDAKLVDAYTYAILGDGCLMEGVSHEAMALAGHLQLGKLIAFYDDNHITIDGDTNVAFTEDVEKRIEAYGWHVTHVEDGNHDLAGIYTAIEEAKKVTDKPSMIRIRTTIGYGSKIEGTHGVHGSPLKSEDISALKTKWGFDSEQSFIVPKEVSEQAHSKVAEGARLEEEWNARVKEYSSKYSKEGAEFSRRSRNELPQGWDKVLPVYKPTDDAVASRKLSQIVLEKIHDVLPELVSGSADLTGSNLTNWKDAKPFQPPSTQLGDFSGRYFHYGVREHGMVAVLNGIDAFGGIIPVGGTFLNFVSYAAGAVRLAALSGHRIIIVATHDSIGLGEDGPTHQPIETLAHLRAIPNIMVWRPADGNETSAAYKVAIESKNTPSIIALSRQNLPQLEGSTIQKAAKGGYIVNEDVADPDLIIASTGSEVAIAVDAAKLMAKDGKKVRVVSIPDFFTFDGQSDNYKLSVFPDGVPAMSVEVMSAFGWDKYTHEHFNLDHFGASAPCGDLYKALDFTPEGIAKRGDATIRYYKGKNPGSRLHSAFKHLTQRGPGPYH